MFLYILTSKGKKNSEALIKVADKKKRLRLIVRQSQVSEYLRLNKRVRYGILHLLEVIECGAMILQSISEKDWKRFLAKSPAWQEAYMERLNKKYAELLCGEGRAAERFWNLYDRINTDKRKTGVIMEIKRSKMEQNIISLINDGAITFADFAGFSDELKETVRVFCK